jgi:ankyrin repeat protein
MMNYSRTNILREAIKDGNVDYVKDFISNIDINTFTIYTEFAEYIPLLHFAARHGTAEIVKLVIDAGADVNSKDYEGWTPLHYAALRENSSAINLLLAAGADPFIKDNGNHTPFFYASNQEIMDLLDLNIVDVKEPEYL